MSSEHPPLADIREEAPSGAVSREASEPTLHNHAANHHEHPPHPHHPRPRRQSTASRVSVDFFDPEGMIEIRRTLTQDRAYQEKDEKPRAASTGGSSTDSDNTLAAGGDGFDLEKTIRQIVRRYVVQTRFSVVAAERLLDVTKPKSSPVHLELLSEPCAFRVSVLLPRTSLPLVQYSTHFPFSRGSRPRGILP